MRHLLHVVFVLEFDHRLLLESDLVLRIVFAHLHLRRSRYLRTAVLAVDDVHSLDI